jgi:hypothetical protein
MRPKWLFLQCIPPPPARQKGLLQILPSNFVCPKWLYLQCIPPPHLAPVMRFAMKVNIAAQMMSRTVAAFLYTLLSRGSLIVTFILL